MTLSLDADIRDICSRLLLVTSRVPLHNCYIACTIVTPAPMYIYNPLFYYFLHEKVHEQSNIGGRLW